MITLQGQLSQRLSDAMSAPFPALTARDVRVPAIPNKAVAVVGMRRAGKTSFLLSQLAARQAAGAPRDALLHLALEDDRLPGLTAAHLDWVLEEYYRRVPQRRGVPGVTLALDEVQVVAGWEGFVRRVMDTERVEVLVTGSSARLLSREVATSLRGRAVEVLVHPFSFREALRHRGQEPDCPYEALAAAGRSQLDAALREYLQGGGFPEAQSLPAADRHLLLAQYVDVVVLRDVIERHGLSNPLALQWLRRELLATPAGSFTVQKLWGAMRSQGISVGKDTVHAMLAQLEDAFLLRTAWRYSASERQRMVNPRKVYPVDPALIPLFERSGRTQTGRALETVIALELERRGHRLHYALTPSGFEIDFVATRPGAAPLLVQVSTSALDPRTRDRELRALHDGMSEHPAASALFLTLDATPPPALPSGVRWQPAARWLLDA
jgi:uncharacterized protein